MNIVEYFEQLNNKSQETFEITMKDSLSLGETHAISDFLVEFSNYKNG